MSSFLESMVANDPSVAPLASNVRYTEDTVELAVGEGFWSEADAIRDYRNDYLDVQEQTAAVHTVMEIDGAPVLFAARLKVADEKITEIETMVVRGSGEAMLFSAEGLAEPSEAFNTPPPAGQRNSRAELVEIAETYPEGLRVGSFVTANAPFGPEAYRLENGVRMAGPGCSLNPPSCVDLLNQTIPRLSGIDGYVVAVDEANGTVLMRLDFGPGSLMGGGGGAAPEVLVTFEAFKIYDGAIQAIEAIFESMPENAPTGWE